MSSSSPSTPSTSPSSTNTSNDTSTPLPSWALALGVVMLGASAGLTLYTKKTPSMLKQMQKVREAEAIRRGPVKYGPPTREEWDKMRPRFEKGDFF